MSTSLIKTLVHQIRREAEGVVSVELRPAGNDASLPRFSAGAHIDLHLPNGITRSYSLCNDQNESHRYVVAVANDRSSRGGSSYINNNLLPGTELTISPPRNNFRLNEAAESFVLVAGGIGVTPLYSMLRRLVELEKQVTFIYCARSRKEAAFAPEIAALVRGKVEVLWHFDDEVGSTPALEKLLANRDSQGHLYCCGPSPMLDSFLLRCGELGYLNAAIERFAATHTNEPGASRAFQLELRRSGKTLDVPEGKTVLRVMLDAGVDVDFGCEEGVCGACETRVFEGDIDHRDDLLSKEEKASNKTMLICVSGCKSERLVLDL
ncbi:PDR/VanB family oxidoreductase [Ottowia thiooxydans]|uniref:PDR/VanB family oxidoreductase n=1 Tax=Ottowia thiooxydans TaxID=219182 RepID=UPI00048F44A6|nr:PDR/VanB family oxidoreductase [Ottowia thiooxydans]